MFSFPYGSVFVWVFMFQSSSSKNYSHKTNTVIIQFMIFPCLPTNFFNRLNSVNQQFIILNPLSISSFFSQLEVCCYHRFFFLWSRKKTNLTTLFFVDFSAYSRVSHARSSLSIGCVQLFNIFSQDSPFIVIHQWSCDLCMDFFFC